MTLSLFNDDPDDAGAHHSERPRRADRDIDDPASDERAPVIDAALDRGLAVGHPQPAPERPAAVRARHFAAFAYAMVI